jgi:hypothetical protein
MKCLLCHCWACPAQTSNPAGIAPVPGGADCTPASQQAKPFRLPLLTRMPSQQASASKVRYFQVQQVVNHQYLEPKSACGYQGWASARCQLQGNVRPPSPIAPLCCVRLPQPWLHHGCTSATMLLDMQQGGQGTNTGGLSMPTSTSLAMLAAAEVSRRPLSVLASPPASLHEVRSNIIWDSSFMAAFQACILYDSCQPLVPADVRGLRDVGLVQQAAGGGLRPGQEVPPAGSKPAAHKPFFMSSSTPVSPSTSWHTVC